MSVKRPEPGTITLLLQELETSQDDDEILKQQLYDRIQTHFRTVATRLLGSYPAHQSPPVTQITDDAFLKLLDRADFRYSDRRHFLRSAAITMRGLVVDHFRAVAAEKRRVDHEAIPLSGDFLVDLRAGLPEQIVELSDLMQSLSTKYPKAMEALDYSRFAGMTYAEIAEHMGITVNQVDSLIRLAKAKIRRAITHG
ncbi:sigma-70 family RNA polymerase sigma factor [Aporhodopirellula aestuarii]|uniref:Sigma-70 family RNA polymerase sigma factor n=1 Tax=Aporhodopirellula aestuarii TaxID=2950107 RepID=A0ABT0UBI8_9BACT|nr:sigma-70 family RNA polymerase sigma factor [Aporhodopirellula aestuarii]MCM2374079.1 sigma-70 family RNA polymerase sigma factor [Aporhodopirellula aestuarii]